MVIKLASNFHLIALSVLFFLQGILICLTISNNGIPLPKALIPKHLAENINLQNQKTLFYLPFNFKLVQPKLALDSYNFFQLKIPELFISWKPNFKALKINTWLIHSQSGEIIFKIFPSQLKLKNLNISLCNNEIEKALFGIQENDKVFNFKYISNNSKTPLNYSFFSNLIYSNKATQSFELNKTLYSAVNALSNSENTFISCCLTKDSNDIYNLYTEIASDKINLTSNKLESIEISSVYNLNSGENLISFKALRAENKKAEFNFNFLKGIINIIGTNNINYVGFEAKSSYFKNISFDSISTEARLKPKDILLIDGIALIKESALGFNSNFKIAAANNSFSAKAYFNANDLKNINKKYLRNLQIFNTNPLYAEADIGIDDNNSIESIEGFLKGNSVSINGQIFDCIQSNFTWLIDEFTLENFFRIKDRKSILKTNYCSLSQNYKCTFLGSINTKDLNSIFPEWWQKFNTKLTYTPDSKVFNNFIISGNIHNPRPSKYLGSINIKNIKYQNIEIQSGNLDVRGKKLYSDIILKNIKTNTEVANGAIRIRHEKNSSTGTERIRTKLDSEISIETAKKLFGANIQKVLMKFDSDHNHKIKLESIFYSPGTNENDKKSYYNLKIESNNPLTFLNRTLTNVSANIYGRNSKHYIRSASAKFADGDLRFEADIFKSPTKERQITINALLNNCNYFEAVEEIFKTNLTKNSTQGQPLLLNLKLKSTGPLANLTNHNGAGTLNIKGDSLAQINLLGPLSRALKKLNISIGIFPLDELKGEFIIENDKVKVQKIEIDGEESNIFGHGQIYIPSQEIDFNMKVDLLKNKNLSFSNFGNIGKKLNPVTRILNFKVTGTIEKQKWRSFYDPRNLF